MFSEEVFYERDMFLNNGFQGTGEWQRGDAPYFLLWLFFIHIRKILA